MERRAESGERLAAVTTDLVAQVVRERGRITLTLHGHSMAPTLSPGTRIQVQRCDPATLRPGQVVAFERAGRIVAHRVMRVESGPDGLAFVTKGDRGYSADDAVISADCLIGLVTEARDPETGACLPLAEPTLARFWVRWGRVQTALGRRKHWIPQRIYPFCRRWFDRVFQAWLRARGAG